MRMAAIIALSVLAGWISYSAVDKIFLENREKVYMTGVRDTLDFVCKSLPKGGDDKLETCAQVARLDETLRSK